MADSNVLQVQPVQQGVYQREEIETIKRTVAKDATDDELRMFLHLANSYGLDPFARDIWFIKDGNSRPIIMTSRDGYLKIANRDANFDGLDADVVYEGDLFKKTAAGVEHVYSTKGRGAIVGAYALVYRKDKTRPVYVYAPIADYRRNSPTWRQFPHAMILKVAEAQALKRAFSISGIVTAEEVDNAGLDTSAARQNIDTKKAAEDAQFRLQERKRIWQTLLQICGSPDIAMSKIMSVTGQKPSEAWDEGDTLKLWDLIERLRADPDFDPDLAAHIEPDIVNDAQEPMQQAQ
ncbi:MAG: phage recombination protein Bet [Synergistaceae bacterium]|nr:phage recombination protein Bet [Synergistaceae bacterium]